MSGHCLDCGNVICLCKELENENIVDVSDYVGGLIKELESLRKERDIYKEMLTNVIDNLQGDFDLYLTGKHIQDELEKRLNKLKHSQSSDGKLNIEKNQ